MQDTEYDENDDFFSSSLVLYLSTSRSPSQDFVECVDWLNRNYVYSADTDGTVRISEDGKEFLKLVGEMSSGKRDAALNLWFQRTGRDLDFEENPLREKIFDRIDEESESVLYNVFKEAVSYANDTGELLSPDILFSLAENPDEKTSAENVLLGILNTNDPNATFDDFV